MRTDFYVDVILYRECGLFQENYGKGATRVFHFLAISMLTSRHLLIKS